MSMSTASLYENDFYGWIQNQAAMLRAHNTDALDFENLVEEIESMGRSEQRELESRFEVLLMHLLKWKYQPRLRGKSWRLTVVEQRKRITKHLDKNPSLKSTISEVYDSAYEYAVISAIKETDINPSVFPEQCPWTFEQVMDEAFWPESEEADRLDDRPGG